jgi:hypothetical protein
MTVPNNAAANGDGDALFTYGEAVIGTDPCTPTTGADFNTDQDTPSGDGYLSAVERYVTTNPLNRCGVGAETTPSAAWPADLKGDGISTDRVDLSDLGTFFAPYNRFNTTATDVMQLTPATVSYNTSGYNRRWDLVSGAASGDWINVQDIGALLAGSTATPPMFGGASVFKGPTCTSPP